MQSNQLITIQSESLRVSADMRKLYDRFENGELKREDADTLANISGKNLKALSLMLADKIFMQELRNITTPNKPELPSKVKAKRKNERL